MPFGLEEDLTCAICCEIYEETKHIPVLLPQCGHSFCRPCLLVLEVAQVAFLCPTCREPHLGPLIFNIPTNYALLSISRKRLIQEKKDEIFEVSKHIKLQINEGQKSLSRRLNAISKEIMILYEQSKVLEEFIVNVRLKEQITRKFQDLTSLKKALSDIRIVYNEVNKVTKDMSEIALSFKMTNSHIGEENPYWELCRIVPGCISTWPKVPWRDFMNKLPAAQLVFNPENPEVFFDLTAGEISLGRITIRLWGHLTRAQHFLALCLGTLGPTYKGSSFHHVENDRRFNRFLIGGYYNIDKSTTSAQGLMENLEWGGEYDKPTSKGLVVGWSHENPDQESTFGFACGRSFKGSVYCPFGEVSSGMEVLDDVSLRDQVTDIKITDCGLIT